MSFWRRLAYAIRYWPIQHPWRWIFNRSPRDNPQLLTSATRAALRAINRKIDEDLKRALDASE
jgi:hypothetical protein